MSEQRIMPVSKLSYSSLTQLLRNPIIFKMKEILGVYDTKLGVSGVIGSAVHEALKLYYGGNKDIPVSADPIEARGEARQFGLDYIAKQNDEYIDYGKTGSRETILAGYTKALDFYFAEEPQYHKILACETRLEGEMKSLHGDILPLPGVGKPDLVVENRDGSVDVIDFKVKEKFTDYDDEDGIKIIQAMFLKRLIYSAMGIKPRRVIFREIKRTENKVDETTGKRPPQLRDWVVPCDHEPYDIIFDNLYKDVVKFLSNDPVFLPNLSDMFDGEHAWTIYSQGLISSDMTDVEVMHKVRDVAFTTKKFVASRLDSEINKNLLPEERIKVRLAEFGIPVEPVETKVGASVTQYRFKVSAGVRMSTFKKHKDDIARALEVKGDVRIIAPIPGTALVGVEVENVQRKSIKVSDQLLKLGTLSIPVGVDVNGEHVMVSLDDMPHLLVAGSTGSGKSVFLHATLEALTKQMTPEALRLILIDPKRVELVSFAKKPHVEGKVIYEYEDAMRALLGLVDEMESRYKILEKAGKRDIGEFNASKRSADKKLPYYVVVIDEFANFMIKAKSKEENKGTSYGSKSKSWLYKKASKLGSGGLAPMSQFTKSDLIEILENHDAEDELNRSDADAELLIVRLAQMARAVGIHLIVATQRPSVDVITGLIKANFPTRIALTTSSPTDSVVILGVPGAERLAGKGDMLFMYPGNKGLVRLQGFNIK